MLLLLPRHGRLLLLLQLRHGLLLLLLQLLAPGRRLELPLVDVRHLLLTCAARARRAHRRVLHDKGHLLHLG